MCVAYALCLSVAPEPACVYTKWDTHCGYRTPCGGTIRKTHTIHEISYNLNIEISAHIPSSPARGFSLPHPGPEKKHIVFFRAFSGGGVLSFYGLYAYICLQTLSASIFASIFAFPLPISPHPPIPSPVLSSFFIFEPGSGVWNLHAI